MRCCYWCSEWLDFFNSEIKIFNDSSDSENKLALNHRFHLFQVCIRQTGHVECGSEKCFFSQVAVVNKNAPGFKFFTETTHLNSSYNNNNNSFWEIREVHPKIRTRVLAQLTWFARVSVPSEPQQDASFTIQKYWLTCLGSRGGGDHSVKLRHFS